MNISELQARAHMTAVEHGWWATERNIGELLALVHSEVSEAFEEIRDGRMPIEIYYSTKASPDGGTIKGSPLGFPTELADILIRVADIAEFYGIDLTAALEEKMDYNETRPYRHGGKTA